MLTVARVPDVLSMLFLVLVTHRWTPGDFQGLPDAPGFIIEYHSNASTTAAPEYLYETTQGQNIPLEPSQIETWANDPPNQTKQLTIHFCTFHYLFPFLIFYSFWSHNRFLHACTPERRTRALAHLFIQRTHGHRPDTIKHILQKNVQGAETLGQRNQRGDASIPHRAKYIGSACCIHRMFSFHSLKFLEVL